MKIPDPKALKDAFLFTESQIEESEQPDTIARLLERKGIDAELSKLIVIAALRDSFQTYKGEVLKSINLFVVGCIVFGIGITITIWSFFNPFGNYIIAYGPIIFGGGLFGYAIYDLVGDVYMKKECSKALEKMGNNDLISDQGSYIAIEKIELSEIKNYILEKWNGLNAENIKSIKVLMHSGEIINITGIDKQINKEDLDILMNEVNDKFHSSTALVDNTNILWDWIKRSYVKLS